MMVSFTKCMGCSINSGVEVYSIPVCWQFQEVTELILKLGFKFYEFFEQIFKGVYGT